MNHVPLDATLTPTLSGILFTTIFALNLQTFIRSRCLPSSPAAPPKASKLTERLSLTRSSTSQFLHLASAFALILSLCYLLEFHPPSPHISKHYDKDWFLTILLLLAAASALTWKQNGKAGGTINTDVLNRNQTEEWKGWMQAIFLLYHYYAAADTYNCVRVLITCYVWLTGFGNFSFFYLKADYSLIRLFQMLFRLNFMAVFLCLTLGNTYILYYICPLHTFFFLMVYAVMGIFSKENYGRGIRFKMIFLSVAIYLVWDTTLPLFESFHFLLPTDPAIGATNGTLWEWYYRTSLDHWSTFLGMCFALNYPVMSCWFEKVEALGERTQIAVKTGLGIPVALIFLWWYNGPYQCEKFEYNATNAYFGIIPLLTYIYFRNVSKTLRGYTMSLLHEIGKTTLETYLLQHHLWLSSNAKSLVVFVPNYPKINFCVVTCVYFAVSRKAYRLTMELRGMLLPDDLNYCLKSVSVTVVVLAAFGVLSAIVTQGGTSSAGVWTVVCLGLALGIAIDRIKERQLQLKEPQTYKPPFDMPSFFPQALTIVLGLSAAATFDAYSHHSASPIQPLPLACQPFVDQGSWVDVKCGEGEAFSAQREAGLGALVGCKSKVWGWEKVEEPHICRFEERNTKKAKYSLRDRHIAYVGDSHVRIQYYHLRNLLGEIDPLISNIYAPYHSDVPTVDIGSTKISFFWKPYVADQIEFFTSIKDSNEFDAVIAGAGQWDVKEGLDFERYKDEIEDIGRLLGEVRRRSPDTGLIWMTPPTVNEHRMPKPKAEQMPESKVSEYRNVQINVLKEFNGLDLFLEAGALTYPRVTEAFDGVHYPEDVYDVFLQIVMQSFDWTFTREVAKPESNGNSPGTMANPVLGLLMVIVSAVGIIFFDSFMGFSYLPSLFCGGPSPRVIQKEAFEKLHASLSHLLTAEVIGDEEEGVALVAVEAKKEEQ